MGPYKKGSYYLGYYARVPYFSEIPIWPLLRNLKPMLASTGLLAEEKGWRSTHDGVLAVVFEAGGGGVLDAQGLGESLDPKNPESPEP